MLAYAHDRLPKGQLAGQRVAVVDNRRAVLPVPCVDCGARTLGDHEVTYYGWPSLQRKQRKVGDDVIIPYSGCAASAKWPR